MSHQHLASSPGPVVGSAPFTIRWPIVALASLLIAIGAVAALAVVASVTKADVLSTVALALAVLAFVIQITVFIAQSWTGQVIYSETRALLGELRVSTADTNAVVNQQFNKLLDRVLQVTDDAIDSVASAGGPIDVVDLKERLNDDVLRAAEAVRRETGSDLDPSLRSRAAALRRWPSEVITKTLAAEGVATLSAPAQARLCEIADQYRAQLTQGHSRTVYRLRPLDSGTRELTEVGIIQSSAVRVIAPATPDGGNLYELTNKGHAAIRLITADRPPPTYVVSHIPWI